tara:strand:+ start:542 stop:784 length:243 start_codon:yes stop_codon:yes gene_type:complete
MTTEVQNEPVLELDGKKYLINDMTDQQKVFVLELQAVAQDEAEARRQMDRLVLAREGYTSRLRQLLEEPDEGSSDEKPAT